MAQIHFRRTTQFIGPVNVGFDGTGYDVTFYGDTTAMKAVWDQSEDAFEVSGCTRLGDGGTTDYVSVDSSGCVLLVGGARVYREIWLGPEKWDVTGSAAAEGQSNSRFRAILLTPTIANDTTEELYAFVQAPNDIDTAACMRSTVYWCADTAQATQTAAMAVNASMYTDGEAEAATTYAGTSTCYTATASDAYAVTSSSLMDDLDPPAVGDLMAIHFEYTTAEGTVASDMQFLGMKLRYRSNILGEAL